MTICIAVCTLDETLLDLISIETAVSKILNQEVSPLKFRVSDLFSDDSERNFELFHFPVIIDSESLLREILNFDAVAHNEYFVRSGLIPH